MLRKRKIYVGKHSKEIQEKAFELGWKWGENITKVINTKKPFLYFTKNKKIKYTDSFDFFIDHEYKEITFEELMAMQPEKEEYQFKPFDKVLGRTSKINWMIDFFAYYDKEEILPYICISGNWEECIPYEGNERLLGTTDNKE